MQKSEDDFIAWLTARFIAPAGKQSAGADRRRQQDPPDVPIGIGDDMALMQWGSESILISTDMLTDGVHFDTALHTPQAIGRKVLAVGFSDCAAMAVRPCHALISVALPNAWSMKHAQDLFMGIETMAKHYQCSVIGGDTNSWAQGLTIDAIVVAKPFPGIKPVQRSGAAPGDELYVSGSLGGSLRGHHMTFQPRIEEARRLAEDLGPSLHAMMDLSDGLSTDARRMALASGCGLCFEEASLNKAVSPAARELSREDGHTPLAHVLNDGEDFELLVAVEPGSMSNRSTSAAARTEHDDSVGNFWTRIGTAIQEPGVWLQASNGTRTPIEPGGWQHFT